MKTKKPKKHLVKKVALDLVVMSREANCCDKPADAGNVERLMSWIYAYGPTIVKTIKAGVKLYLLFDS